MNIKYHFCFLIDHFSSLSGGGALVPIVPIVPQYLFTSTSPCFSCDVEGIDKQLAEDYCWMQGSSYIPLNAKVTFILGKSICLKFS